MSAIEYAFTVACFICIACMVIIELKPKSSPAFDTAFNTALILLFTVIACVLGYGAYDALRGLAQ
jgi:hypothetical protein